jgi:hypothetical protein
MSMSVTMMIPECYLMNDINACFMIFNVSTMHSTCTNSLSWCRQLRAEAPAHQLGCSHQLGCPVGCRASHQDSSLSLTTPLPRHRLSVLLHSGLQNHVARQPRRSEKVPVHIPRLIL